MKIISWNMKQKHDSWRRLLEMDIDLALLQEARKPPPDVAEKIQANTAIEIDSAPWQTTTAGGRTSFRTAIAKLSDHIEVEWIEAKSPGTADSRDLSRQLARHADRGEGQAGLRRPCAGCLDVCAVASHA